MNNKELWIKFYCSSNFTDPQKKAKEADFALDYIKEKFTEKNISTNSKKPIYVSENISSEGVISSEEISPLNEY